MNADDLYNEAMKLPADERRKLALRLLASVTAAPRATATWEPLDELRAIVHLGGRASVTSEAVADSLDRP